MDWELYRDSRQVVKIRLRKAEHEYINKEMEGCQNTSSKCKLTRNCLPRKEPGGGSTRYIALYAEATPERGTFFRLQV